MKRLTSLLIAIILLTGAPSAAGFQNPVGAQTPVSDQSPVSAKAPVGSQLPVGAQSPVGSQPPVATQVSVGAQSPVNTQDPVANYDGTITTIGAIGVRFLSGGDARVKARVQKDTTHYDYDLFGRSAFEYFPLQLGNGDYTVTIFENVVDNRYRVTERKVFNAVVGNLLDVFRNSIQTVRWNHGMKTIIKADALCANLKTDKGKIQAIYQFVTRNFKYDYVKIKTLQNSYVPNIDKIYAAGKGICYDYAAVFAAMLRSQKIPAKLIKGYTDNVKEYHAWNEVYLSYEKRWIVVDTTFDSVYFAAGRKANMEKAAKLYRAGKEY